MRLIALVFAAATLVPATVCAQDPNSGPAQQAPVPAPRIVFAEQRSPRPLVLPTLYVSLAGLQGFDAYTTLHAVNNGGGHEANLLMGGLAERPAAFWAVKAGSTAMTIVLAEALWRSHHRGEAIATMVAANGLMAYVAAHNASVVNGSR